ncbi:hypothetical protein F5B18DRAFT_652387 [Nemania serpens]|nr:hypothetical protein F5B18DRAFT_652387 [Nemania serpens]
MSDYSRDYMPKDGEVPKVLSASSETTAAAPVVPETSTYISNGSTWPPSYYPLYNFPCDSFVVYDPYFEGMLYQPSNFTSGGSFHHLCCRLYSSQTFRVMWAMALIVLVTTLIILLQYADPLFYLVLRRRLNIQ